MFGKKMIALVSAGFTASALACGGCSGGSHHADNSTAMEGMPEDFDMASLEKMFADMFGKDFNMNDLMNGGGMDGLMGGADDEEMDHIDFAEEATTCPAPTLSNQCPADMTPADDLSHLDESEDSMDVQADEGVSPVQTPFVAGVTPAQVLGMTYPKSYGFTKANGFTSMEEGTTPFEGFTCAVDSDMTPVDHIPMGEGFTAAVDSLDSMDDSHSDEEMCSAQPMCDAGMCGMDMCGLEEPAYNNTSSAAFNSTDMCGAGMCGMEPPATSAEEMFNNTNTCGDGFQGAMCRAQKNITGWFSSNDTSSAANNVEDNLDSSESEL